MKKLLKKDVGESKLTFIGACNMSRCISDCNCGCPYNQEIGEGRMTGPMYGPAQSYFNYY